MSEIVHRLVCCDGGTLKTALMIVFLCCGMFASAQTPDLPDQSGNAFVRVCSAIEKDQHTDLETLHVLSCMSYVSGFVQGVFWEAEFVKTNTNKEMRKPFCRPKDVENAQLVKVVLKYIRENPEEAHEPTAVLIISALAKVYPCSTSK
jgi:Ssp1 endopeptidase immunity protein Rap1a